MIRRLSSILAASVVMSGVGMGIASPRAQAATHFSMSQKQVVMDGQTLSHPYGLVYQNTTYLPIYYMENLLQPFGVKTTWNGHNWNFELPSSVSVDDKSITSGKSGVTISLNGHVVEHVIPVVAVDPASKVETTFLPVWYINQIFEKFQIAPTWNGTVWSINTSKTTLPRASSSSSTASNTGSSTTGNTGSSAASNTSSANASTTGSTVPTVPSAPITQLTHEGVNDTSFYQRASNNIYLSAQTGNPLAGGSSSQSMDEVEAGQPIYLYTWEHGTNVDASAVRWLVNGTQVSIQPDTTHRWELTDSTGSGTTAAEAQFVAPRPGVYTVQAQVSANAYSVPLTIIVGASSLEAASAPNLGVGVDGIRPFSVASGTNANSTVSDGQGTSFLVYPTTPDGWIPISGTARSGLSEVQVTFGANPGAPLWSYTIPVDASGHFAAEVRSPVAGTNIPMMLFTQYVQDMTSWGNGGASVDSPQTVHVNVTAAAPSAASEDLFASAKMNFNLQPDIGKLAMGLYTAAGSDESAIQAINDYVADDIVYDQSELQTNGYRFQNVVQTWGTHFGICEDFAELEASMLKAVGIRAETIQGVADDGTGTTDPTTDAGDNHEWIQAWDGTGWILADPTWSSADTSTTDWLTNEFFTQTVDFQPTHQADVNATGTPQRPRSNLE